MKHLPLIAAATIVAANLHAQGTVNFANSSATAITNGCTMSRVVAGTTFKVSLYFLPATGAPGEVAPTSHDFDMNGIVIGDGPFFAPGLFSPGARTAPTQPAGGFGWFQVRAWETAFGATYQEAVQNPNPIGGRGPIFGTSNIIRVDTGDPTTVPPGTPGSLTGNGLQGFTLMPLTCIPEPATTVLWLFSLTALFFCRRKLEQ